METALASDERTPLLGNRLGQPFSMLSTSNQQTPLDGNYTALNEQAPIDGKGSTSNGQTLTFEQGSSSNSDANSLTISCQRTFQRKTNKVSLEEIVQALYSAWQRNRQPKEMRPRYFTLDFFTTKEIYAMHLAWKNVTRGKHCSSQPHIIAEAVAVAMANELCPARDDCDLSLSASDIEMCSRNHQINYATQKNLLAVHLLEEWPSIEEGYEFPVRYIETIFEDSDEQPLAVSEFRLKQVELYDKIHDFILNRKLQILLHSFLFIWPISILIIGSKYMECPMGHHLSHLLMILGCVGYLAILFRIVLMHLSIGEYPYRFYWKWMYLRVIEFTFLVVFLVEAYHFFDTNPETELDPNQCVQSFYNAALVINCVSITLVSVYVIVYSIKFCLNQNPVWHLIFRYL